jgi:hypothetical protein
MGDPHVVKYPIGVINVVTGVGNAGQKDLRKSELLLRYRRTPAVAANRTKLAYSQDRTPGMCTIVDFWPC